MVRNDARPLRVLVGGHDQKFWIPLQRRLEKSGRFEFREDLWTGHERHDRARSLAMLAWADVIVAEWTLGNAVFYARHKKPHQRLITRFHLQERNTPYPSQLDYGRVDKVVFVGAHIMRECVGKFGIPKDKACVVPNFVDVDRYDRPKFDGAEFNLGIVGIVPSRKRLDSAVDTLGELLRADERYTLHVKGGAPFDYPWVESRQGERDYYMRLYSEINGSELRNRVVFDPSGDDVADWFQQIGYLLSPSDFESFHMAAAEGLSAGSLPVFWSWEGADEIYRQTPLVSSPREAAAWIRHLSGSKESRRLAEQGKRYVRAHFDAEVVSREWSVLLEGGAEREGALQQEPACVLVVWAIDNWGTFHRREMIQALAASLSGRCQVLVIEPGNYVPGILELGWADADELRTIASGDVLRDGIVHRTRLLTGGLPPDWFLAGAQGSADPFAALSGVVRKNYGRGPKVLHWLYKPDQALKLPPGDSFIYEAYDDYTYDFGSGAFLESVARAEAQALAKAEHVFFTSQPLFQRKSSQCRRCSVVGNGVDYHAFSKGRLEARAARGRPLAGYLGNLSSFFDWQLMRAVCGRMAHVDFVFHGQIEEEKLTEKDAEAYRAMTRMPNVRFTGRVNRSVGAAAVNRYDVLIIPFVANEAMEAVNPLKLWEYFATGLPVVSTPMEAISDLSNVVRFASGYEQWVLAIEHALSEAAEDAGAERVALAAAHSWDRLIEAHAAVVRGILDGDLVSEA